MTYLSTLMGLLCAILLIVGLIKPSLVIRWGAVEKRTKKMVVITYTVGMLFSAGIFGMAYEAKAYGSQDNAAKSSKASYDLLLAMGKERQEAEAVLGGPAASIEEEAEKMLAYDGFTLKLDAHDRVSKINVTADNIKVMGIKVGMSPWQIIEKLGSPEEETNDNGLYLAYKKDSVWVEVFGDDSLAPIHTIRISDGALKEEKDLQ